MARSVKQPGRKTAATAPDAGVAALVAKRRLVREWWVATTNARSPSAVGAAASPDGSGAGPPEAPPGRPADVAGLALSGGGIRSATFSLGVLQALAKSPRDAFSKVDIISSVSGGGYISCFLRSLFMPGGARGIVPKSPAVTAAIQDSNAPVPPQVVQQYRFARDVLGSSANDRAIPGAGQTAQRYRNPLWWLREHSRYLAPNGPTDYGYAFAYLSRNWLAMLYIFLLAVACIATPLLALQAALLSPSAAGWAGGRLDWLHWLYGSGGAFAWLSPILLLAPVAMVVSSVLMTAYWMTERMSSNDEAIARQVRNLLAASFSALALAAIVGAILYNKTPGLLEPAAKGGQGRLISAVIAAGLGIIAAGAIIAILSGLILVPLRTRLTAELRRRLTTRLATANRWLLLILGAALIDTLAAWLARDIRFVLQHGTGSLLPGLLPPLVPALAVLLNKLSSWAGGGRTASLFSTLARFADKVALVLGLLMFGALAILSCALVHLAIWEGDPWISGLDGSNALFFVLVAFGLGLLGALADGFINLSSLHTFYASRLTRAYLGATNIRRLIIVPNPKPGFSIRDNAVGDYIQPELYSRADLPAPIHIINATLNETRDPGSQIVARDRKGHLLSVEPGGVRVAGEMVPWSSLGGGQAEQLSLGQWCAISGAAASSAMGRLTNLGFALALTFANVRLGYWWWAPGVCCGGSRRSLLDQSRILGPYLYLFNEMTARYSRSYQRKYLTDGGHFENSGAYRLIEQRVPLILVSDNGADPDFQFADLENLTRKVRLDLGAEVEAVAGTALGAFAAGYGCTTPSIFIDPSVAGWREQLRSGTSPGFVLALQAKFSDEVLDIFWIKPRLLPDLPPDLAGYALVNGAFPQQPTSDQFFDEAQWESYRKLGELSMKRLLEGCTRLL